MRGRMLNYLLTQEYRLLKTEEQAGFGVKWSTIDHSV